MAAFTPPDGTEADLAQVIPFELATFGLPIRRHTNAYSACTHAKDDFEDNKMPIS